MRLQQQRPGVGGGAALHLDEGVSRVAKVKPLKRKNSRESLTVVNKGKLGLRNLLWGSSVEA